jgi:hypothetical protein
MATHYEWAIETLDRPDSPEAEIVDVDHADTYAEAAGRAGRLTHARIALVRDWEDATGYGGRAWAYVEAGALATHLEDASGRQVVPVPKRFRLQFDRA